MKNPSAKLVSAEFQIELVNTTTCVSWSGFHQNGVWNIAMRRAFHHPRFLELRLSPGYRNAEKIVNKYKMKQFEQ